MSAMKKIFACMALACLVAAGPAVAGRTCEDQPLDAATVRMSMALAERTAKRLDETGAQVVILGRAGQNLDRYGLEWSHMGFAYHDGGVWRVAHKLNECNAPVAGLHRQGLGEFFLDRMYRYEAVIAVLAPEVQERLLPVLKDNARLRQFHVEPYNMLAYPWSLKYQQSNQWLLETLAGAVDPNVTTRRQAQAWMQLRDYRPTTLRLGPMTRLGAEMTRANIAFDDHPNDKRFSDRIETVTVDSVLAWLPRAGLAGQPIYVR
ncbi:MAG: DUF2145 domain-containing protein [Usitatibacter sp.]